MSLLDFVFKLLFKGYLITWARTQNPYLFATSSIKTAFAAMFFFILLVPSYKVSFRITNKLDLQLSKFIVVFGPMALAFLIGWLLSNTYYDRRGKYIGEQLSIQKLTVQEKLQLVGFMMIYVITASGWSLLIASLF